MNADPLKPYVAGGNKYKYPLLGDEKPPAGAIVIVLTIGGIAHRGPWTDDGFCVGWAELPARDHDREKLLPLIKGFNDAKPPAHPRSE